MRIVEGMIVATDSEALALLSPDIYPITPALNEAAALQADEIIHGERDGIVERFNGEKNEFIDEWLWRDKQYLTALKVGIQHRIYEDLSLRSHVGRFVEEGVITERTRHALFTYRPNYDIAQDEEPSFTFEDSLAPDLEVFYRGLKRHQLESLGSVALDDVQFGHAGFPEDNWEYQRTSKAIKKLEKIRGDARLPVVPMPTQPKDVTVLNYMRNWREALFMR